MINRKYIFLASLIILVVLLSACSNNAKPVSGSKAPSITDVTWVLTAIDKQKPIEAPKEITLTFSDGKVHGNSGCNIVNGSYSVDGNKIQFSQMASTMMACMEPEGVMDQEQKILQRLDQAKTFQIENGSLVLIASDQEVLTYASKK